MLKFTTPLNIEIEKNVFLKPEYLIHAFISGNKYRKLKYNLQEALTTNHKTILTFGGAFSNHIAATAAAGQLFGLRTIGIIRGEELAAKISSNPTLKFAKQHGMRFKFVTREAYRNIQSELFLDTLKQEFGPFYNIPEGGTNSFAVKGCEEILTQEDAHFDYVCCSVGTGGTLAGLINCSKPSQQVLGFPALKGDFLKEEISKFVTKSNWDLITDYHFGGYAKINQDLISFINDFKSTYNIPLDPVYTGKLVYGVFDLMKKGYFRKDAKILIIHTGGLQGIAGMNTVLLKKDMPLIQL